MGKTSFSYRLSVCIPEKIILSKSSWRSSRESTIEGT